MEYDIYIKDICMRCNLEEHPIFDTKETIKHTHFFCVIHDNTYYFFRHNESRAKRRNQLYSCYMMHSQSKPLDSTKKIYSSFTLFNTAKEKSVTCLENVYTSTISCMAIDLILYVNLKNAKI